MALSDDARDAASGKLCDAVIHTAFFQRARFVACYLPTRYEVDTWPIIERGLKMKKRIFAPVTKKNAPLSFLEIGRDSRLATSDYGLQEPVDGYCIDPRKLDLVITPLVAFDAERNRIGMGGGYYDRTFAFLNGRRYLFRPKLIGVAFDCQRVEHFCASAWDIPLFQVFTESGRAA